MIETYQGEKGMVERLSAKVEKLERQNARLRELYESSLAIVRRYQDEREGFLDRVQGALLGIKDAEERKL